MIKRSLLLLFVVSIVSSFSLAAGHGEGGVDFQDMTLAEALVKAKNAGKKVFVDCHTKTCGPCRYMERNIFTTKECGAYLDSLYVCLMKDMEEGEGVEIAKKYKVMVYPTFLVINPDGSLYFMESGSSRTVDKFLSKMSDASKYVEMTQCYDGGERSESFMKDYMALLARCNRQRLLDVIAADLIPQGVAKMCEPDNWMLIKAHVGSADDPVFGYLLSNRDEFISGLGRKEVEDKIMTVYREELRVLKMMTIDFDKRIVMLKKLEKEGYPDAAMVRYGMSFRRIINNGMADRVDELISDVSEMGSDLTEESSLVSALSNLSGIELIATPAQQKKLRALLSDMSKGMSDANARAVSRIMSRLKQDS